MSYPGQELRQDSDEVLAAVRQLVEAAMKGLDPKNGGNGPRHNKPVSLLAKRILGRSQETTSWPTARAVAVIAAMWEVLSRRDQIELMLSLDLHEETAEDLARLRPP